MSKDNVFIANLNPLIFLAAEDRPAWRGMKKLTPEAVLEYICSDTIMPEMQNLKNNYTVIAENAPRLFAVPIEFKILRKMVYPLKNAIGSYMLGNYLETIALCGMVSEMSAMFLFEISDSMIGNKSIDEFVKSITDRDFEKLGQEQRVRVLSAFGLINDKVKEQFDIIRNIRREYLHLLSKGHENMAPDAKKAFDATLEIVSNVLGLGIKDGRIIMNQTVLNYLEKKGFIEKGQK